MVSVRSDDGVRKDGAQPPVGAGPHPLDHPVWSALTGPQAELALGTGQARRFPAQMSPFAALADHTDPQAWTDLADLVGPDATALLCEQPTAVAFLPSDWTLVWELPGVQLVGTDRLQAAPDPQAVELGPADVEEMLALVARTEPGPFGPRTPEFGGYLGIREEGRLIAMAGERMQPGGWSEISAVCTDPQFRGRGLASRLIRAVAHGIRGRGLTPMLHAAAANPGAVRLYESLGFAERRRPVFLGVRTPPNPGPAASD